MLSFSLSNNVCSWIHVVLVTGLAPATTYHYRCGDSTSNEWSADKSFKTESETPEAAVFATYVVTKRQFTVYTSLYLIL